MEVVVSVGITITGLVVVLSLMRYVTSAGRLSSDRFVAAGLAQEGVEIVRSFRDSNWLNSPQPWNDGLNSLGEFQVQYDSVSLQPYSGQPLKIDSSGFYNYTSGQNSKFIRRVVITPNADVSEPGLNFGVTSEVSWEAFGRIFTVVVDDILYNWY